MNELPSPLWSATLFSLFLIKGIEITAYHRVEAWGMSLGTLQINGEGIDANVNRCGNTAPKAAALFFGNPSQHDSGNCRVIRPG